MSDTEGLSQRLRELRKSNRLSQSVLAELTGVSFMTIRRWESGEVIPRISGDCTMKCVKGKSTGG